MIDTASLRDFLPSHMLLSWALFGLFFFEAVLFLSRKLSQPLLVFFFAKRCYGNGDHTSPHGSRDTSPCDESSTAADTDDEADKAKQTQVQSANPGPAVATRSTTTGKKNKNKSCHAGKQDGEKQQFPTTTSSSPSSHNNRADSRGKNIFYTALSKKKQNDWDMYVVSFSYAVVMAGFGCYAIMYPAMHFPKQEHARYDGLLLSDTDRSVFPLNLSRWFFSTFFPALGGTSKNQAPVFNNDEASLYLLRRDGYSEITAILVSFTAGLFLSGTIRELIYGTPAFTLHHFIVLLNCCIALNGPYFLYWTVYLYTWEISNIGLNSMGLCEIMPEFSRGKVHAALRGLFFVLFLAVRVVFGTPLSYYCLRDLFGEAMRLGAPSEGVAGSYTAWTIAITSSIAFGLNAMWAVIILRKGLKEIKRGLMGVYFSGDKLQLGPGGTLEMMSESHEIKEE